MPADVGGIINPRRDVGHPPNNSLFPNSVIHGAWESHERCRSLCADLHNDTASEKWTLRCRPETLRHDQARGYVERLREIALRWWNPQRLGTRSQFRWIETDPLPEGLEPLAT